MTPLPRDVVGAVPRSRTGGADAVHPRFASRRLRPHPTISSFRPVRGFLFFLAVAATLEGCGNDRASNPVKAAFVAAAYRTGLGTPVAFRFSGGGDGEIRSYRLPDLEPMNWHSERARRGFRSVLGLAADRDVLYAITTGDDLVGLDLATSRIETVDSSVALGVLSPTGTPIIVRKDGSVASVELRSVVSWSSGLSAEPELVWGGVRNRLVAVMGPDSARSLVAAADGQAAVTQPIPGGRVAVSAWGDLVLVAGDSGVGVLDPIAPDARRFLRIESGAAFAIPSASGHRFYVGRRDGALEAFDRFTRERVSKLTLPGVPKDAREDRWGRYLLVRADSGTGIWIVDAVAWTLAATLEGAWDDDLPTVGPDGTVVLRRGTRVEAWPVGAAEAAGRVSERRGDRWIAEAWNPQEPTLRADASADQTKTALPGQLIYVQVSSTSNPDWAADLVADLHRAGMAAEVLPPDLPGDPYRVVLGPYATREEAEATGRQLKLPYWIFTRDTTSSRP
jgi:hypothetical protein